MDTDADATLSLPITAVNSPITSPPWALSSGSAPVSLKPSLISAWGSKTLLLLYDVMVSNVTEIPANAAKAIMAIRTVAISFFISYSF